MHLRRIASFVLGAWIVGSLFLGYIAMQNATVADRLLGAPSPDLNKAVQTVGVEKVRVLLAYQAAEQTRSFMDTWERAQIFIGVALLLLLLLATRVSRLAMSLCGVMIVFTAFAHFVLRPEIDYLGRGLDFIAGPLGQHRRLWVLRTTYLGLEVLKLAVGCGLAGYLFVFKTRQVPPVPAEGPVEENTAGI